MTRLGNLFLNNFIHFTQDPQDTYLSEKWPRLQGSPVQYHFDPAFLANDRVTMIMLHLSNP